MNKATEEKTPFDLPDNLKFDNLGFDLPVLAEAGRKLVDMGKDADAETLKSVAESIRQWQIQRPNKMSDEALVRRFPGLGSTKTFNRIVEGDLKELRVESWLDRYRSVLDQIDDEEAIITQEDDIYDDITPARSVRFAMQSLLRSRGLERLVLIEGGTGSGKTCALRCIEDAHKGATVRVEATEGWRSFTSAMGDIAMAIGVTNDVAKLPVSGAARLSAIIKSLGASRKIILIDEGHHMTTQCLNAVKTMINQTGALFVIAAQETIWRKLQACAWQEVKQLIYNRMRERVRLGAPHAKDVVTYIERRTGATLSTDTARTIGKAAATLGDFACLRRLAEALLQMPAEDRDDKTALECIQSIRAQLS